MRKFSRPRLEQLEGRQMLAVTAVSVAFDQYGHITRDVVKDGALYESHDNGAYKQIILSNVRSVSITYDWPNARGYLGLEGDFVREVVAVNGAISQSINNKPYTLVPSAPVQSFNVVFDSNGNLEATVIDGNGVTSHNGIPLPGAPANAQSVSENFQRNTDTLLSTGVADVTMVVASGVLYYKVNGIGPFTPIQTVTPLLSVSATFDRAGNSVTDVVGIDGTLSESAAGTTYVLPPP